MSSLTDQAAGKRRPTHRSRTRVKPKPAPVSAAAPISYTGIRADGAQLEGTGYGVGAVELARALYDEGARSADLTVDGRLVGQVCRNLRGDRTWWGAKS